MDVHEETRALSRMGSQLSDWYPKVYGANAHGDAVYAIEWLTDGGSYSTLYKGSNREHALRLFRKFPKGKAYGTMRDAVSGELLGEIGRNDFRVRVAALMRVANSIDEHEQQAQRVATRTGTKTVYTNRRQLLLKQAAVLWAACNWPGG